MRTYIEDKLYKIYLQNINEVLHGLRNKYLAMSRDIKFIIQEQ